MRLAASFAFTAGFYLWSAVLLILALPLLAGPRAGVIWLLQTWNSGLVVMLRGLCGVRVEIRGREHLPKGAALIAMKHQCMFDAMGLWHDLPGACYVLKKSLMLIPLFGWFAAKARMIVVDRQGHAKALRQMMSDAKLRVKEGRQVIIFPEGTRKKPGAPTDYKPGVAGLYRELDLPVIPVATNAGVHWSALTKTPGTIVYEFLAPIGPGLKRAEFMRTLEERLEAASTALVGE